MIRRSSHTSQRPQGKAAARNEEFLFTRRLECGPLARMAAMTATAPCCLNDGRSISG